MPDIRDLLPPPPWELFKFGKEEYIAQPYTLRLDAARGVLYVDNTTDGNTVVRICRIPEEVRERIPRYGAVLDLQTAVPSLRVSTARDWKKAPVFIEVETDSFFVTTESGEIILEVLGVPRQEIRTLENREFTDIATGFTGRTERK